MRYDSASRRSFLLTFKTVAIGCSLFLVGLLSRKPLSQMHRSTFLPLQHAETLIVVTALPERTEEETRAAAGKFWSSGEYQGIYEQPALTQTATKEHD